MKNDQKFYTVELSRLWKKTFILSFLLGMIANILLTLLISRIALSYSELKGSPKTEQVYTGSNCGMTYSYPVEKLILPADQYAIRYLTVGKRIFGQPILGNSQPNLRTILIPHSRYGPSYSCPKEEIRGSFIEDLVGYPFVAARSSMTLQYIDEDGQSIDFPFHTHEGIFIYGDSGYTFFPPSRDYLTIPLRPVFPGFLYNTLIYSIPFAGFILSLRWLRVWKAKRRVRRGQCVACGYDIAGLDRCPECATWRDIPWKPLLWAGCKKSKFKLLDPGATA